MLQEVRCAYEICEFWTVGLRMYSLCKKYLELEIYTFHLDRTVCQLLNTKDSLYDILC